MVLGEMSKASGGSRIGAKLAQDIEEHRDGVLIIELKNDSLTVVGRWIWKQLQL